MSRDFYCLDYGLDLSARRDTHDAVAALRTIQLDEIPGIRDSFAEGPCAFAALCRFGPRDSRLLEESVLPMLADGERARFESLRNPRARAQYLASRLLVKTIVGVLDCLPASSIETAHAPDGSFVVRGTRVHYHASIAHTTGAAALLLSASVPVGIDIERLRKPPLAVARKYFSADEYRTIGGATDPSAAFFRLWTLKESLAKLEGAGVIESLRRYEFALDGEKVSLGGGGGGAAGPFRFESVMLEHHVLGMAFGDPGVAAVLVRPVRCGELLRYAGQS
ncbi:MAG: 4'-phosphopantetheinyl transferase superfamily protein [Spirochaetes bacterium]|jgi:phosphopantetheinyl transferase|nr:4'-phosphopantetheinyl transferase superfamily protein [Spirochaetota bacterium]